MMTTLKMIQFVLPARKYISDLVPKVQFWVFELNIKFELNIDLLSVHHSLFIITHGDDCRLGTEYS